MADAPSGIYMIRCLVNGKVYVGSAVNIQRRWRLHINALMRGNHDNTLLQRAWKKHGADAFAFEVIEFIEAARLIEREQYHIDQIGAAHRERGYNLCPTAGNTLGFKFSAEARAKITAANKGRKASAEARARISAAGKGRTVSAETRAKQSATKKGRKFSAAHRAKISAVAKSRTFSAETRAKMAVANRGCKHSAETKAKISAANKGRVLSAEAIAKVSAARRRKPLPDQMSFPFTT